MPDALAKDSAQKKSLTLLHISDLHFGQARGDGHIHFDQVKVVGELVKDAAKMAATLGAPDLILVTGDIAFSAKPNEYTRAKAWLEELAGAVGVGKDLILLVPGNHDVDRGLAVKPLVRKTVHSGLRADPKGLEDYLLSENESELAANLWPKLEVFSDFASSFGAPRLSPASPFWRLKREVPAGKLLLLGLNTCLLSYDGGDAPKNLALGRGQILKAFKEVPGDTLVLPLMHHPLEWLVDGDEMRKEVQKYPHLLFSGHVHQPGGGLQRRFGQGEVLFSDAGAAHGSAGDGRHAYAWLRVYREGLDWYPRVYHESWNAFRVDGDRLREEELARRCQRLELPRLLQKWVGQAQSAPSLNPSAASKATAAPRLPPTPFIPQAWADYLETSYGHLEPLLNTERPRRPRIEALYVPLSTSWQSPNELKKRGRGRKSGKGRTLPDEAMKGQKAVRRPLSDLLAHIEVRHFLLEGVPGGGKSTFARHAAMTAIPKDTLPIYLELKNFGAWLARHPEAGGANALLDWAGESLADLGLSCGALKDRLGYGRTLWLLDGLDEIFQKDVLLRAARALGSFLVSEGMTKERGILLSRPHALRDPEVMAELRLRRGHARVELLSPAEQLDFIGRWFDALYGQEEVNRQARVELEVVALGHALDQHPYLSELRQTPLHLGLMAALYFHGRKLPDRRAELFDRALDWLLNRSFGPKAPGGSEEKVINLRLALAFVARQMMEQGAVREVGDEDFRRLLARRWCPGCGSESERELEVRKLCQAVGSHSGLVTVAGYPPIYRFVHLAFQEFLAAWNVGQEEDPVGAAMPHLDEGAWKETLLLTAGWLGTVSVHRLVTQFVTGVKELRGSGPELCRRLYLAVQGAVEAPRGALPESLLDELRSLAVKSISDPKQPCPVTDRLELGLALGRLGDPRLGLERPQRWVWVPPGVFQMGEVAHSWDLPIHEVKISGGFWLGKYPVTNEEYAAFVYGGGYEAQEWWDEEGWAWQSLRGEAFQVWFEEYQAQDPSLKAEWAEFFRPGKAPYFWGGPRFNARNQPVVGVSWFEARAFGRWLKGQWKGSRPAWLEVGQEPRLPSEAEWEYAARGPEGREYPWGSEAPTSERANYAPDGKSSIGTTSPVGNYPSGAGPFGALDQAGNVGEWCADLWHGSHTGAPDDGRPWIDNDRSDNRTARVLRGGSWIDDPDNLSGSVRFRFWAGFRGSIVGFRLCVGSVSAEHG